MQMYKKIKLKVCLISLLLFAAEILKLLNLIATDWAYTHSTYYLLHFPLNISLLFIIFFTIIDLFLWITNDRKDEEK